MFHQTELSVAKYIYLHYEMLPCNTAGLCPLVLLQTSPDSQRRTYRGGWV